MSATNQKFALSEAQQARLLACRAAWDEGEDEERLERLRQGADDAETLRAFQNILKEAGFADNGVLNYAQCVPLLALVRALAPNPNLDVRLLRQAGEPAAFSRDLHDLLYREEPLPSRVRAFLARRHAGIQTISQLLCAAYPDQCPLMTRTSLNALELTPEQRKAALADARERYALPAEPAEAAQRGLADSDPVLQFLSGIIIYEAVYEALESRSYVEAHRLLTRGLADSPRRVRRFAMPSYAPAAGRDSASIVREEAPQYEAEPARSTPLPAAPDIADMMNRDALHHIENYVAAQGFTYPALALRDYYIALQTRPFCILSGITGTGKTRLTSLFAEALTDDSDTQYRLLPVRPDWNDSAPLLGYVNLLAPHPQGRGQFVSTPFLEFLRRAAQPENAWNAFFLCLDEMNLARVEHYFAEVLSAMETPARELLLPDSRVIRLPANLFLTGTLNLDESTHALSRKVLDRANTIAFDEVCLRDAEPESVTVGANVEIGAALRQAVFLQSRVTTTAAARGKLRTAGREQGDFAALVVNHLAEINDILQPHGLPFAYRLRDEVLRYCANSFDSDGTGLLVPDTPDDQEANLYAALDLQILQKVLPRFTGSRDALETPTRDLLRRTETQGFPRSARKLARLLRRLQRDNFVAFDEV